MESLLILLARGLIAALQALPLRLVARLGRAGGALAYWLDARHRRVARENLTRCFGTERTAADLDALVRENFRRLGENYACAIRTAAMSPDEIDQILTTTGAERVTASTRDRAGSALIVIGHFGNFELYARANRRLPEFQFATTYRALRQPGLTRLMQALREQSGCLYFERRTQAGALRDAMNRQRIMLGLLADQDAGDRGLAIPFFGRECATSAAPAVFALRYQCPIHVAICYRTALARWHIEVSEAIPTHDAAGPRDVAAITLDINRAYEEAIRRDPANWFWVHRRWKRPGRRPSAATITPSDLPGSAED
jgi:KDO2-lipid IV(A) lauroyltransferase